LAKGRDRPQPALDLLSSGDRSVVVRALDLDADRRFATCSEFVQALETGEATGAAQAFLKPPHAYDAQAESLVGSEPTRAMDRLHRLLAELGGDLAETPTPSGKLPNPLVGLERCCGARVYGATARLKLEGFRQQWRAKVMHVEPAFIGFRIEMGQSFWRRCLGKEQPGVEVTFQFQQPQTLNAELTEVTMNVRPVGCDADAATRILNEAGPLILENARSYLHATPERRGLDRLKYDGRIQVMAVYPGQANGPAQDCVAKDISMRGIGYLTKSDPAARQIVIVLPGKDAEGPVFLPAEIVRIHHRADGYREVGARFAFGGFHARLG
jgi:hypothetical protein